MNLYEFFNNTDVRLPLTWDKKPDFELFVKERLEAFQGRVAELDSNPVSDAVQSRLSDTIKCCGELLQSLRDAFNGHPHDAYQHFDLAMQAVIPEIQEQSFNIHGPNDLGVLYRVRHTPIPELRREDLFHIPFECRHLVSTQRYSIPGLPCLYLSGSLYTCWEEMGRPPLHELQCAAFWVKKGHSLKILNFSNRPGRLISYARPPGNFPSDTTCQRLLSSHIVLWPLIAMSSVAVKHRDSPFKPEYVIPQMALQWVTRNHNFDGIAYFSTHVKAVATTNPLPTCNLVLPAQNVQSSGRCTRLCECFKMTEPYGWQLLSSVQVGEGSVGSHSPMYEFEFIEGIKEPYCKTEFGSVEMKLNKMVTGTMCRNSKDEPSLGDVSPM
ncbi:MAG: hypothetical protein ACYC0X_19745 [Pirellulaceae bacterium]